MRRVEPRKEKVAVIGSGPAGIAAAADLAKKGYSVTVFERQEKPGGLLRYGIGDHRLPEAVLDRELQAIENMGVSFSCGQDIDLSEGLVELKTAYDAILVTVGGWTDRKLGVPGEDLDGVEGCLSFLTRRQWQDITGLQTRR